MEQQLSFADSEYRHKRHRTRKEKFLERMEKLMPWARLEAVIEPFYPKPGNGRRPYPMGNDAKNSLLATVVHLERSRNGRCLV